MVHEPAVSNVPMIATPSALPNSRVVAFTCGLSRWLEKGRRWRAK
ncbi:MAG TPA: hypothetical protein VGL21_10695 [Jatrophihabitantaceae bacterium]